MEYSIEELFKKGFHYGHRKWSSSSKMNNFVFGEKWGLYIIDLCKTVNLFSQAMEALSNCINKGGNVVFVGTKSQAKDVVKLAAESCNQFYINKRWLGGTLTNNHSTIELPLKKLKEMEAYEEDLSFQKLTKHERLLFSKKKDRLLELLSGIRELSGLPDMLIVVDPNREWNAITEAKKANVPVIALADTDTPDPNIIDYIVPGNDEGNSSITYFLNECVNIINSSRIIVNNDESKSDISNVVKEVPKNV